MTTGGAGRDASPARGLDPGGRTPESPPRDGPGSGTPRRLRILLVIKCLGYGGAERLLVETVATGDRAGFDYEVAYVLSSERTLVPDITATGTPVHDLGAGGNGDLGWLPTLRRLLVGGGFDVVHFHLPYAAALGRLVVASLPAGRRPATIYTEHNLWGETALPVRWLNRATAGRDRAIVAVSESALRALPRGLAPKARAIVHGVDLSRADELVADRDAVRTGVRAELGLEPGEMLALTVANLRPEKGYEVLLAAARIAVDHGVPVRFACVGRGPLEAEMATLHRRLGLGDHLRFLGPRQDVLRLLVGADLFVLSSHYEGLPVTLMESSAVGIAIVATAVGGVPQVVTDGRSGLLVPPGDPVALAAAVERLVADPALRSALGAGVAEQRKLFDVSAATAEVEGIYRAVAGVGR